MLDKLSLPAAGKWVSVLMVSYWLRLPGMMQVLVWAMVADYAFGMAAAYVRGELSSRKGLQGLVKKVMVLALLLVLHVAERQSGLEMHVGQIAAMGYLINEMISIVENCARAGIPIPAQLVDALLSVKRLKMKSASAEQLAALEGNGQADK